MNVLVLSSLARCLAASDLEDRRLQTRPDTSTASAPAPTSAPETSGGFLIFPPVYVESKSASSTGLPLQDVGSSGGPGFLLFPAVMVEEVNNPGTSSLAGATSASETPSDEGGFLLFPPVTMNEWIASLGSNASTTLVGQHHAGSTALDVADVIGFQVGHIIDIDGLETNEITGFGSIMLKSPLQYSYSDGVVVTVVQVVAPTPVPTASPTVSPTASPTQQVTSTSTSDAVNTSSTSNWASDTDVEESGGLEWWIILLIVVASLALCSAIVGVVMWLLRTRRLADTEGGKEQEKTPFNKVVPDEESQPEACIVDETPERENQANPLIAQAAPEAETKVSELEEPAPPPPLFPRGGEAVAPPAEIEPPPILEEAEPQIVKFETEAGCRPLAPSSAVARSSGAKAPVVESSGAVPSSSSTSGPPPEVSVDYVKNVLPSIGVVAWETCSRSPFMAHHRESASSILKLAVEGDSDDQLASALVLARAREVSADQVWFAEVCRRRRAVVADIRGLVGDEVEISWRKLWSCKNSVLQELLELSRKDPKAAQKRALSVVSS